MLYIVSGMNAFS